jgi:DhnA family fructose-bisphosphate aldolase class Ia
MAAEAGADMVKIEYTGDPKSFAEVVASCAVPVVMMGGSKSDRFIDFLTMLEDGMNAGAKGVAVGRNLFLHANPALAMKAVRRVVREHKPARVAAEELEHALAEVVAR